MGLGLKWSRFPRCYGCSRLDVSEGMRACWGENVRVDDIVEQDGGIGLTEAWLSVLDLNCVVARGKGGVDIDGHVVLVRGVAGWQLSI